MYPETIGIFCGALQTVVGHPLDTLKVWKQNGTSKNPNIFNLYRGVSSPLILSSFTGGVLFGTTDKFNNYYNNYYISGFFSGLFILPLIQISEFVKINRQSGSNIKLKFLLKNSHHGLYCSMIRESISGSVYFGFYFDLVEKYNWHPFLSGGIAGCSSWIITYPIDVIKTRVKLYPNKITYIEAYNMGSLWKGLNWCLMRAFVVNGVSFYLYNYLSNL
tara:strand:- start:2395 stop:3048 length:654 start_codon:yes stop_codon:yes gene_type:complete